MCKFCIILGVLGIMRASEYPTFNYSSSVSACVLIRVLHTDNGRFSLSYILLSTILDCSNSWIVFLLWISNLSGGFDQRL